MTDADGQGPTATSDALAGTRWSIVQLADAALVEADDPLELTFGHDGRVSGSTGVNQLTASYSLTANYVTFGPLATTRRAGTPEQMDQEQRVIASLAGMCPFHVTTHTLSIDGPLGRIELVSTTPLPTEPAPQDAEVATDPSPPAEG